MATLHEGLLSDKEVARRIGKGKSTVWRYVRDERKNFPQPIKLGPRDTKFPEDLVDKWIQGQREAAGICS